MSETPKPRARVRAEPKPATKTDPFIKGGELEDVLGKVEKKFGLGAATRASARPTWRHVPTGIFTLDMAFLGGVPAGLTTLLTGWKSSGKTTTAMRAVTGFQKRFPDQAVAFLDIEGTYDPVWGLKHGVDNDRLILIQPSCAEDALDIGDAVLRAKETSMMVVDSIAGLIPTKEIEADTDQMVIGRRAMMIRRFLHKTQQAQLDERKRGHWPTLILINQYTMMIGVTHGDPRTMPGGKAPEYQATYWAEIKNKEVKIDAQKRAYSDALIDTDMIGHNEHSFAIKKNKLGNGLRSGEFVMARSPFHPLGEGFIDDAKAVLTEGKRRGFITGGGASWRIAGLEDKFRNGDEMIAHCYSDLDWYAEFQAELINHQRGLLKMDTNMANWR